MNKSKKNKKQIIKDTFLYLLEHISYEDFNISILCKESKIARTTFYFYYNNLNEVLLEILDEAFEIKREKSYDFNKNNIPLCQKSIEPRYKVLFKDKLIKKYIGDKLYGYAKKSGVERIMKNYKLSEYEAEKIFVFLFYGNLAVNDMLNWEKNEEWEKTQKLIKKYIKYNSIG